MNFKIGFACMRYPQTDNFKIGTTTLTALSKLSKKDAQAKLIVLATTNAKNIFNLVSSVAEEPEYFRMLRIGSSVWPMYDLKKYSGYDVSESEHWLKRAKKIAKENNIRLSFHPDQFNALASTKKDVVQNTITNLNIHGRIAKLLGATEINIHCWGKGGVKEFKTNAKYLDKSVLKRLTVENDEFGVGLYALENIGFPIVLDVHHHWVNTGNWCTDKEFKFVLDSWNRKPKLHYSYPKNCVLQKGWPVLEGSRTKARMHSDTYNNKTVNKWILNKANQFGFDIMCEAKHKDVARNQLFNFWRK